MRLEEIDTMKYRVCCPMCENKNCVRGTDSCEAEQWAKSKTLGQEPCKVGTELAHWIDNHNGTISCSHCNTWFNKDDRYFYMRHCPYCNVKMVEPQEESEDKE